MWSYYGSKIKICKYYPLPEYDLIIEPFAGSAWYSVLHRGHDVLLNEKNEVVFNIWDWLINKAEPELILEHKEFFAGQDISSLTLSESHKNLIGFCINRGSIAPKNIVQKWSCQVKAKPDWASTVDFSLKRVARLLPEIKHWKVKFGDYKEIPNIKATWFIDPPYQFGGENYIVHDVDYTELANWCRERRGQVVVCENSKANWLPFNPLIGITGQRRKTVESVWRN